MKRYEFYMPVDLFEKIKLLAKNNGLSTPKMMIKLLEIGYLKYIASKSNHREISELDSLE